MARDSAQRARLGQALAHLQWWHHHLHAAGAHHGRNQQLSDELLGLAIEHGAQGDTLRGDLTWDEVVDELHRGGNDDG